MTTARFDHVGLSVADLDVQKKFYGDALGLTEVEEHLELPDAGVRTAILRAPGGLKIELIERSGSRPQEFADAFDGAGIQGYFHWALYVEDLAESFAAILAAGATAVAEPGPAMRAGAAFAYVKDPEGNLLELIQPAP
ncbi:VOC family protein [Amycolatopsis saalfeldensis]|uniref:Lactoylglutathione lyase n=1 Tax=Amycolatopsis saalfeldensis TaxID=394193 RepID=A0A1H8YLX7_9PSEU|nr:VOC family protein [Amycolatopsis saalfeldensis]SEP53156.1 lactoylglutathione lyase [Amycolatopsis saalfeldensis]